MHCYFCQKGKKLVDFKDVQTISRFLSAAGKVKTRRKTGLCAQHQRQLSRAIKRSRFMGLLPYVKE